MPVSITCPECDRRLKVADAVLGKKIKYPGCGGLFVAQSAPPGQVSRPTKGGKSPKPHSEDEEEDRPARKSKPSAKPSEQAKTSPLLVILLILGGVGLLVGGGLTVYLLTRTTPGTLSGGEQVVSAEALAAAFKDNLAVATQQYKDRTLAVSGIVKEVDRDNLGNPFLTLYGRDELTFVACQFNPLTHARVTQFQVGQRIKVRGTCAEMKAGIVVVLKQCELLEVGAIATPEEGGPLSPDQRQAIEELDTFGAIIQPFNGDKSVTHVTLHGKKLTDREWASLEKLPMIEHLALDRVGLEDKDLPRLKKFPKLKSLSLQGNKITDAGLVQLQGFTALEELSLIDCSKITDAGLNHLKGLKQLKSIDALLTGITEQGAEMFQKVLPSCKVVCRLGF